MFDAVVPVGTDSEHRVCDTVQHYELGVRDVGGDVTLSVFLVCGLSHLRVLAGFTVSITRWYLFIVG